MVLFAGPIVIEWYYLPIFVLLGVVAPVVLVGLVSELILRAPRRSEPLTWAKRRRTWAGVAVGWLLLALVFDGVIPKLREGGEARATKRALDFTPHEPQPLPATFSVTAVNATLGPPRLVSYYLIGSSALTDSQQRPVGRVVAEDGKCALTQLGPKPFRCRERRTPAGIRVFFAESRRSQVGRRMAFAVLDGTLVRVTFEPLPEDSVLAYFDSLRPVDKDDIEFTRG